MAPLPMNVAATGTCRPRASARSSGAAPRRRIPLPARMIGRSEAAIEARGVGDGLVGRLGEVGTPRGERHGRPARPARTSPRRCPRAARCGSARASRASRPGTPCARSRGCASACSTRVFHFVTGSSIRTMSTTWWASLWSLDDAAWPVIATIGARSRNASATPVMRFVAPGPERPHRDRGAPGQAAVDVGHERRALLVAGRDVADPFVARQRVEDVHRLLARAPRRRTRSPRRRGSRRGGRRRGGSRAGWSSWPVKGRPSADHQAVPASPARHACATLAAVRQEDRVRPSLNILAPELIDRIVDEAKRVLAEVGMEIRGPEMRRRLLEAGLPTNAAGDRVLFPRDRRRARHRRRPARLHALHPRRRTARRPRRRPRPLRPGLVGPQGARPPDRRGPPRELDRLRRVRPRWPTAWSTSPTSRRRSRRTTTSRRRCPTRGACT